MSEPKLNSAGKEALIGDKAHFNRNGSPSEDENKQRDGQDPLHQRQQSSENIITASVGGRTLADHLPVPDSQFLQWSKVKSVLLLKAISIFAVLR